MPSSRHIRGLPGFDLTLLGGDGHWRYTRDAGPPHLAYLMGSYAVYSIAGRTFRLSPHDVFICRESGFAAEGEGDFVTMTVPSNVLREAPALFESDQRAVMISVPARAQQSFHTLIITLAREQEASVPGCATVIRAYLLDLLTMLYRIQRDVLPYWRQHETMTNLVYRHRVLRVVQLVEKNLQQRHTLTQLAAMAGLNRTTFCRIYKSLVGRTPRAHLLHTRTLKAQRLLTETDLSMNDIAEAAGFNDLSSFFRTFRRRVKMTPLAYRKAQREQR